ncbi:MAG: type I-U CRISPR-associated helicase/endonuclease Cas3 [Thermoanaerobaculum sp.]|nr:type I-U CRISPR-associated helicase/endonuclease Cas3 [Thermoanaerobaculum sp.]MDW7968697.1 type I-U CRISPR-associated helicase/endonuclease Cas3 [Thermoanaerobaculum sp.]
MSAESFSARFAFFFGAPPYPWQERLFELLVAGQIPEQVVVPTGLGKTAVMLIWLLALADQTKGPSLGLPRRLIYVVNRRTVVDQATAVAESLREKLLSDHQEARTLREQLGQMACLTEPPLAISTLRGQFADNGEWKEDPSRPAIIVGTVDMVGSKILFAGYGDGRKRRPVHAGLLGHDALLVHDEAHLDPAFHHLLQQVVTLQRGANREPSPASLRVMALTATPRDRGEHVLTIAEGDRTHPQARKRLEAKKIVTLVRVDRKKLAEKLAETAASFEHRQARVLIFVRSPKDAQEKVLSYLKKKLPGVEDRVALLTGTMRGFERDQLLRENQVFSYFLGENKPAQTHYLVATSAGEVGIDLDADHLVTELAPLDSLLQRLGRVNRRGGDSREAEVHIVIPEVIEEKDPLSDTLNLTAQLLKRWQEQQKPLDLAPLRIAQLMEQDRQATEKSFSPKPPVRDLFGVHLDFLTATSLSEVPPGSPSVAHLLHGLEPSEPEVSLFWRKELNLFPGLDEGRVRAWFELCPPAQRELLRLPLHEFSREFLGQLRKREKDWEKLAPLPAVILWPGAIETLTMEALLSRDPEGLAFATIGLPPQAGGLDPKTGCFDAAARNEVPDVADGLGDQQPLRQRVLVALQEGGEMASWTLDQLPWAAGENWNLLGSIPLQEDAEGNVTQSLCLFAPRPETAREEAEHVTGRLTLEEHTQHVMGWAELLCQKLGLRQEFRDAILLAVSWHDKGKSDPLWQYFAFAEDEPEPLAKAARYRNPRVLAGFRHEWASVRQFTDSQRETGNLAHRLALHLIASHHGWGRPHFPANTKDPETTPQQAQQLAVRLANNFAELQHQLGWWQLAWLEAIFRAADALASRLGPAPQRNGEAA